MMKRNIAWIVALCLCCGAAGYLLRGVRRTDKQMPSAASTVPVTQTERQTAETTPVSFDRTLTLRLLTDDGVREISLHDYLVGVLAAELPSDFPTEALRAQAVASRTFALRKAAANKHTGADVCASAACCQGWREERDTAFEAAVSTTDGLVLTYDGALIDATFFSSAAGRTEAAVAVWGGEVPYLQSVESPEDTPYAAQSECIDAQTFADTLTAAHPELSLSGAPETWFGAVERSTGGGIARIKIGGQWIAGTELRRLFSLRSTDMELVPLTDGVQITTHGYGHRVGMSQYGARTMALQGSDFEGILLHYYSGARIEQLRRAESVS